MTPFRIAVPQATLDDLRHRLANTRLPASVAGAGWDYGTDLDYLRDLLAYWRDRFDWRAQEQRLNTFPQFLANVEGTQLHFIHARSEAPDAVPLLLLHGWPSSFWQMTRLIPLLTNPSAGGPAFHVVAASLPGSGFSSQPTEPGMGIARIGGLFHQLMTQVLGYSRYGIRASDLGAGVAGQIALAHPAAIVGYHTGGTNPWVQQVPDELSPDEQRFVQQAQQWGFAEMAYAQLQATKPHTLAVGLNDSPAGLAAWIVEKFRRWSDCGGDVERRFSKDDLLTNLTIYWATGTIGSSVRLYYETVHGNAAWGRPDVPTAMLMPRNDMFPTPRAWAERSSRIDRWTETDRGGHFLEWEEPQLVADDLRAFFATRSR